MAELVGAFAVFAEGEWASAQQSVVSMFGGEQDEFLQNWPKAGTARDGSAHRRSHVQIPKVRAGEWWPTPAASLPNETEEPAGWLERWHKVITESGNNSGVPLGIAAESPLVLKLATWGNIDEARRVLDEHRREPNPELLRGGTLNPTFVEVLMGFPDGWTDVED